MQVARLPLRTHSLRHASNRISQCLAYDGMLEMPRNFERFSNENYQRRVRLHPDIAWEDACPAYALALATHTAYAHVRDLQAESELEMLWNEVSDPSTLDWTLARTLMTEAWRWLDHQAPALLNYRN